MSSGTGHFVVGRFGFSALHLGCGAPGQCGLGPVGGVGSGRCCRRVCFSAVSPQEAVGWFGGSYGGTLGGGALGHKWWFDGRVEVGVFLLTCVLQPFPVSRGVWGYTL